ncbi:MAG: pyridoxine 5'-phosphate synthase [Phycisphaerae bacterium]|nr:pyridoxine 5'-phosphate synthase [Phycisphaerae bacterium]
MPKLNVNIDHVATIRQARLVDEPDPVWAASACMLGGASGITMHLREDRRHIQDRDVQLVRQLGGVMLNLEMALTEPIIKLALKLKPEQVTLVPEKREELTTEGGLDCVKIASKLKLATKRFHKAGILVSAFIAPDQKQLEASCTAGVDAVELHTGEYANATSPEKIERCINEITEAVEMGWEMGMTVHAGHGLNYRNIGPIAGIDGIEDFNIGHSIIARSIFTGIQVATREMLDLIDKHWQIG